MSFFNNFSLLNFDLLSVGIAIAAIGMLGFLTYFNDRKKITSQIFLGMSLSAILWSVFNYLSYQFQDATVVLWLLRLAIFNAVWFSYYIFWFFYTFPTESVGYKKIHEKIIFPAAIAVSILNLTPLVFNSVSSFSEDGRVSSVKNGPAIILFGLAIIFLIFFGASLLEKKRKSAAEEEKKQITLVLWGIIVTSALLIIFNYIFPAILNNPRFVPLGAVFLFPFVAFTAYAIFRHKLFDVKIIATEILTFLLSLGMLFDILVTTTTLGRIVRFIIFILVVIIGILLISSVRREVKQREQLEILSKELGDANEKLKALDQARAEFITIASHQLRTPPTTIKWYLSAILNGDYGRTPAKILAQLAKIQTTNNHLISLIEDMLNVSRIERGKMEFLFEPTDPEQLAKFCCEQLLPLAKGKNLKLTYHPPKKRLPKIMADKEKLRQVMNNLIDNAIKYTPKGKVDVSLLLEDSQIKFQVKDTGKGVDPEERESIFQKYTRGKESVRQSAGLGLGLYVAKIIIDQHKGKLWVESPGAGKGSVFGFTIPVDNGLKQTTLVDLASK
jgi:signal transduction histidine kinase